jgi:hypothetical protein|tara:strand:+ start:649 stop:891 length:243 start_codon:yes stop_codon:yes gene_type:complete
MGDDWIQKMGMKPGALHRQLGVSPSYTFNRSNLKRINKTGIKGGFMFEGKRKIMTPLLKKRVTLAITLMGLNKKRKKQNN